MTEMISSITRQLHNFHDITMHAFEGRITHLVMILMMMMRKQFSQDQTFLKHLQQLFIHRKKQSDRNGDKWYIDTNTCSLAITAWFLTPKYGTMLISNTQVTIDWSGLFSSCISNTTLSCTAKVQHYDIAWGVQFSCHIYLSCSLSAPVRYRNVGPQKESCEKDS